MEERVNERKRKKIRKKITISLEQQTSDKKCNKLGRVEKLLLFVVSLVLNDF